MQTLPNPVHLFQPLPSQMMRNLFFFLLLAIPQLAASQSKCDLKILETEQRRFEAMVRKDTVVLNNLLADDLVYIHSNALTENKKEHISNISTGRLIYEKMTRERANVRRYGKTALSNGIVQVRAVLNANPFEVRLAYTATYRKKGGVWRLVNWQSTRVP